MLACVLALASTPIQPILITESNFNQMRDSLAVTQSEMEWRAIDWKPSLWSAIMEGNEKDKPILLWYSLGSPLGCADAYGILSRQNVWKSKKIQTLAKNFVCAADSLQNLLGTDNVEQRLFAKAVPSPQINGNQFVLLMSPSGISLGTCNVDDENVLASIMEPAISRYGKLTERRFAGIPGTGPEPVWRSDQKYPKDGLVLREVVRDLSGGGNIDPKWKGAFNLDYVWFSKADVAKMLPPEPRANSSARVATELVNRFARLHLLDNVRGVALSFEPRNIQNSELQVAVTSIQSRNGLTIANLVYTGNVLMTDSGEWPDEFGKPPVKQVRGIDLQLYGRASIVWSTQKFTTFEMIAAGRRWGASPQNNRKDDAGPSPIGFLFTIAANLSAERVPPLHIDQYGW